MKSILDAADWSKESTFTQFYLKIRCGSVKAISNECKYVITIQLF